MDILNKTQKQDFSKPEISLVQKQKHEYKLLSQYMRTKGLKLYEYSNKKDSVQEVNIKYSDTAHVVTDIYGRLTWVDLEAQKTVVDSRNIYFEALNFKSAEKKVEKFKEGKIKELCNLKEPRNNSIEII